MNPELLKSCNTCKDLVYKNVQYYNPLRFIMGFANLGVIIITVILLSRNVKTQINLESRGIYEARDYLILITFAITFYFVFVIMSNVKQ
jgi:glucose uptake protein GlcU